MEHATLDEVDLKEVASSGQNTTSPSALATPPDHVVDWPVPGPGDWIGHTYRIESALGGGAMGLVYSAVDEVLERKVAVKLIRSNLHPASFRKRFMLEARAMALVSHPNVLTIHALGEHEQNPFIVMELVEGQTLDDWIALRRFHPNLDVSLELGRPRQHHSPFGPRALEPRSLWALRAGPSARIRDALGLLGFLESRCP